MTHAFRQEINGDHEMLGSSRSSRHLMARALFSPWRSALDAYFPKVAIRNRESSPLREDVAPPDLRDGVWDTAVTGAPARRCSECPDKHGAATEGCDTAHTEGENV